MRPQAPCEPMQALVLLVLGIALVDGLNPTTIAPALVLAVRQRGVVLVLMFTCGVFFPSLTAGVLVVAGPGQVLLGLIPHVGASTKHLLEIGAAVALAGLAWTLWKHRGRVAGGMSRDPPGGALGAAGLGAGIILAELPTAVPYFAALAAIIRSSASLAVQIELVALFNLAFILPLLVILGVRALAGPRSEALLELARGAMNRYAGVVLPCAVGLLAAVLLVVGVVGVVRG
jgi:Sap, sulfolipid-1-addressing protein